MAARFFQILILVPAYFLKEINLMYYIFLINSICTYMMSYMLTQRVAVCLEYEPRYLRYNQFGLIIMFALVILSYTVPMMINP